MRVRLDAIEGIVDLTTLGLRAGAAALALNDLAVVRLSTSIPIVCDAYDDAPITGSFILVDEVSHDTVAAGILKSESGDEP